nr:hypothetical protein [Tanacetum cinerariifolium]
RDNIRVVLVFTSFFLICMSSAVTVTVLPFFLLVLSLAVSVVSALWQLSSLVVGTSFASGNSITGSGNALCILYPTFYAYARGIQSRGDVYSTKHILAVTHVSVMRKHGYGYLEEIVVRRADNNRLINLLRDDVADFAIALRMFTRSLVIQKRVKDLQFGVESYQKHINVTKPQDQISEKDTRIHHTKTLKDSFMSTTTRGTDITNNIDMEYLPKRRWSILEKKRAHYMIKDINKLLKKGG